MLLAVSRPSLAKLAQGPDLFVWVQACNTCTRKTRLLCTATSSLARFTWMPAARAKLAVRISHALGSAVFTACPTRLQVSPPLDGSYMVRCLWSPPLVVQRTPSNPTNGHARLHGPRDVYGSAHLWSQGAWQPRSRQAQRLLTFCLQVDVYGFGVTLWAIWTRRDPYPEYRSVSRPLAMSPASDVAL